MNRTTPSSLLRRLLEPPYFFWILIPFVISYLLFFRTPPEFAGQPQGLHLGHWIWPPSPAPGMDLQRYLTVAKHVPQGVIPYSSYPVLYPPLAFALFVPLTILEFHVAYSVMTAITLASFILTAGVLPAAMSPARRITPIVALVLGTGLFSYGLQFELERGQDNVLTFLCVLLAVWLFHFHPRFRWGAYVLLSLAIQLKLYPLIFAVMLIHDWHDWKSNLRRLAVLSIANAALFFVMGLGTGMAFINALRLQGTNPVFLEESFWINSSIVAFVRQFNTLAAGFGPSAPPLAAILLASITAIVAACMLLLMLRLYRQRSRQPDPYLLMGCAVVAMLLPTISNDYKLPMLAGPAALVLSAATPAAGDPRRPRWISILLTFVFSLAYSSTLFSFVNKVPVFTSVSPFAAGLFVNNFAPLFVMLLAATGLALISRPLPQTTAPDG